MNPVCWLRGVWRELRAEVEAEQARLARRDAYLAAIREARLRKDEAA